MNYSVRALRTIKSSFIEEASGAVRPIIEGETYSVPLAQARSLVGHLPFEPVDSFPELEPKPEPKLKPCLDCKPTPDLLTAEVDLFDPEEGD